MKIKDIIRESVDIGKGVPPEESKNSQHFCGYIIEILD